ncbi:MAG: SDR family oxidoreductase [Myxococcales bacterium]|nr:SDR family oxidoreductase [Myxococcales bacterium]
MRKKARGAWAHALITGGSSGIGKEVARLLVREGTHVTLIARRGDLLDAAAAELRGEPSVGDPRVLPLSADVGDEGAIRAAIRLASEENGAVDALILCAGEVRCQPFEDHPPDSFERLMRTNYLGSVYPVQEVLPGMRQRRSGNIVFLSSGTALAGIFGYAAYGPTKYAVHGLAAGLRTEFAPEGVQVSVVFPPDTDTPQLAEENRTKPWETKVLSGMAKMWQPDRVASHIVEGMGEGRFVIAPGWEMAWMQRLGGVLAPPLYWWSDFRIRRGRRT